MQTEPPNGEPSGVDGIGGRTKAVMMIEDALTIQTLAQNTRQLLSMHVHKFGTLRTCYQKKFTRGD
jgi:hypothetical protein